MPDSENLAVRKTNPRSSIGVVMLDTQFPRFHGDIGNPDTWPFQVHYKTVPGAHAKSVIEQTGAQPLAPFVEAAQELQALGVGAVTTSCGFLMLHQAHIAAHLTVPFVSSSLMQMPWVQAMLPADQRVGILTISSQAITPALLKCAGVKKETPIVGTEDGAEFTNAILSDALTMNQSLCEKDNIAAAQRLMEENGNIGAIVLECTNMAPYAHAINAATKVPVYSIYTLIRWLQAGLSPATFKPQHL